MSSDVNPNGWMALGTIPFYLWIIIDIPIIIINGRYTDYCNESNLDSTLARWIFTVICDWAIDIQASIYA